MDQIIDNNGKIFPVAPGAKIWGADLRGRNLEGAEFPKIHFGPIDKSTGWDMPSDYYEEQNWPGIKTDLTGANLSDANLVNCNFNDAEIDGCNFSNAKLTESILMSIENALFRNTELSDAIFEGFYDDCNFEGAVLNGAHLTYDSAFSNCIFRGADVSVSSCDAVTFLNCDFTQASCSEFHNGVVTNCNFDRSNLESVFATNAEFANCSFINSSFIDAILCTATFSDSRFVACNFADTILDLEDADWDLYPELESLGMWLDDDEDVFQLRTSFYNCTVVDIDFSMCNLKKVTFKECSFENSKFTGAQLDGTEFIDCTFTNCDTPEDLKPK